MRWASTSTPRLAQEVRRPPRHLLGGPERDLGLVAGPGGAVDLRTALAIRRQHVQGRRIRHGRLAVAARHLDVDAPEAPLAVSPTRSQPKAVRQDEACQGASRIGSPACGPLMCGSSSANRQIRSAASGSNR